MEVRSHLRFYHRHVTVSHILLKITESLRADLQPHFSIASLSQLVTEHQVESGRGAQKPKVFLRVQSFNLCGISNKAEKFLHSTCALLLISFSPLLLSPPSMRAGRISAAMRHNGGVSGARVSVIRASAV